jgi:hypothetical protein
MTQQIRLSFFSALVLAASSLTVGCSSSSTSGAAGTGAAADIPGKGATFYPDVANCMLVNTGGSPSDLKLEAATLVETEFGKEWLVALRNTGMDTICSPQMNGLLQADEGGVSGQAIAMIHGPMYRSIGVTPCLANGEVGLGSGVSSDGPGPKVEQILCKPEGVLLQGMPATKLTDVTVDNLVVTSASSVTGTVTNGSALPITALNVYFFAMDGARPIEFSMANAKAEVVAPGGHWDFSMPLHGPVPDYKVFPEYVNN